METEESKAYRWEGGYERTWEALREDDTGALISDISATKRKKLRQRLAAEAGNRLQLVRHCVIVLDMSRSMSDPDFRIDKFPNRVGVAIKGIQEFIPQFYSASPLGQLGLVVMKDRRAERLVSLGGSPAEINTALQKLIKDGFKCSGQCSLINAINVSKNMLTAVGEHSNKEIIFIVGALSTVDPESPENTIQKVVTAGIRCSIVSLSAEVHLWRKLAERTSGDYFVPLDVPSIFEKLELISRPPKDTVRSHAVLIRMGFPIKEAKGKFLCPQCKNRVASLPTTCEICKLKLVSAPHLARSYHHLFPPAPSIPCIPDVQESENTPRLLND